MVCGNLSLFCWVKDLGFVASIDLHNATLSYHCLESSAGLNIDLAFLQTFAPLGELTWEKVT